MEGWIVFVPGVCDQSSEGMDKSVVHAAMTGVSDLTNVFQLLSDTFHQPAFVQEQFVPERQQLVFPVALPLGNPLYPRLRQAFEPFLAEIATIPEQLAPEPCGEIWPGDAIIHITGREAESQQGPFIVHNEVQLEAIEPTHAALSALCRASKYLMTIDAPIVTDGQRQAIDKSNPTPGIQTCSQIGRPGDQHGRKACNQA